MLKWIAYKPPAWKVEFWRIVQKIPFAYRPRRVLFTMDYFPADAAVAFRILGPEAAPAVPALSNIVKNSRSRRAAMWALSDIGKEGLPTLMDTLEDERTKEMAAFCIVRMCDKGVDISRALPSILMVDRETSEMAKTNNSVFFDHIYAIGVSEYWRWNPPVTRHPQFLVSALTNCMHHTNLVIQVEAINGLGRLGEAAQPAVPALKEALDVRVIAVQEAAVEALELIAPEVLTNGVAHF
jgi:HEAT repeat protein